MWKQFSLLFKEQHVLIDIDNVSTPYLWDPL